MYVANLNGYNNDYIHLITERHRSVTSYLAIFASCIIISIMNGYIIIPCIQSESGSKIVLY